MLSVGAAHSDNIRFVPRDGEEDTIEQAGIRLRYEQQARRLSADIDLNAAYQAYAKNSYEDQFLGGLDGTLLLGIVPDNLEWFVSDNFAQRRLLPASAATPGNSEDLNYFTTGPDFIARTGDQTLVRLSGRYSSSYYEQTNLDGTSYGGTLALVRELSASSLLSLNAGRSRYEFDDAASVQYDRDDFYFRYEVQTPRTTFTANLGYTFIDDSIENRDGILAQVTFTREVSASSAISLNAGSMFADGGRQLQDQQQWSGVNLDAELLVGTNDLYGRRFAAVRWDYSRNRTGFGLNAEYDDSNYERLAAFDRTLVRYGAYARRLLSPKTSIRLDARVNRQDFASTNVRTDELWAGVNFMWQFARSLSLTLQYYRTDGKGSELSGQYTEDRASLYFSWSPVVGR